MLELENNGFYPLTDEHLNAYVPMRPGVYMLAVRLANGVHENFFTSQSDNLHESLKRILEGDYSHLPPAAQACLGNFQPYFNYFIIMDRVYQQEVEKMLAHTSDPVLKLNVVNAN
ncbi:MAG TPA: hypothetical protein VL633_11425 [Bacteroidota bacterium]|nr:hypothetical protein [Bacteroidota bacterium]